MPSETLLAYAALEANLRINRFALDEELVNQPNSYYEAARGKAQAISRRDGAKDALKKTQASAYGRIRARLEKNGKPTEAMISTEMELDKEIQDATTALRNATEDADLWDALQQAWLQRSYALKDLVTLHQTSYIQSNQGRVQQGPQGAPPPAPDRPPTEADYETNRARIAEARAEKAKAKRERID